MKDINAIINTPAKSDIIIPDDVNKYLQNGDKIFNNYSEYSAKAKEISDEITEKIKDAEARKLALQSFRYDQKTDLYYFTDIKKDGHKLYASTYSVADHERKKYSYQEDLGDYTSFEKSRARLDAEYYISLLEKSIPEGFSVGSDSHDYLVYTKVRDIDAYLIFSPVDPSSYIVSCDLYNDVAATGKVVHELLIGDDGVGYVHKYNVTYNFDCEPKATCTACGFILNSTISNHRPCFEHIEEEDGKIKWRFVLCDRCDGGMIDFYSDNEAIVRVELDKMNYSISDAIVKNSEGLIEHYVPDFKNALVISEIEYIGKGDRYEKDSAFSVIIPDLRNCSDYRIIGVVEASRVNTHPAFIDLTLPEGVEFLSRKSFYKSAVKTITLPNTLMYIDDMAFDQSRIEELTIPESVIYMGDNFGNCYLMKKLVVNSPELEVFPSISAPALETLKIYSRVEKFKMFRTVNFTEFTIPDGVKVIEGNFQGCCIEKIILPSTLQRIGASAFANCENLRSVKINSEITNIGINAFYNCKALSDIKLPSSVEQIEAFAFEGCVSLTDDAINQCTNLKGIYNSAFDNCTGLKNIVIPESVEFLGSAFSGCKFKSIRFKCAFKNAGEFEAGKVIYEGEILGEIRFGGVTEIHAKTLPTVKSVKIGGNAKIVYFAGSEEAFENAGYTWDETVTVNFDVDFSE
jgi:hypothetical protein